MTTTPAPRAQTLRFQKLANRVVRVLLHTPLVCAVIGRRLVEIEVVGRKSGRCLRIPVAYTRRGSDLLVGTPFPWGRNVRSGEPVQILLRGKHRTSDVTVVTDESGVTELYAVMAQDNKQFAKFNEIGFDDAGNPSAADLALAWRAGARAFVLTPR